MTRCESYPPCFGTIYFPTAPILLFLSNQNRTQVRAFQCDTNVHFIYLFISLKTHASVQILLRCADRCNVIIFHQILQHIRRDKCRKGRSEENIFDPQMKQCQQDTHCFLLIPGEHHGKRQIVDTAVKCFCQCHRNLDGAVSVVALSHLSLSS